MTLSDYCLLRLNEPISLRKGDVKQIGDSLRGCQREPVNMQRQFSTQGM